MQFLQQFIIEATHDLININDIIIAINNIKKKLQRALLIDNIKARESYISKLFDTTLKPFTHKKVDSITIHFVNDRQADYNVDGVFAEREGRIRIAIKIHENILEYSLSDNDLWDILVKNIAITVAHELTHAWQMQRRQQRRALKGINKYGGTANKALYYSDPEEIAAWSNDIVNELTPEFIRHHWKYNEAKIGSGNFQWLSSISTNLKTMLNEIETYPDKTKKEIKKKLMRKIAELAGIK